MVTRIVSLLTTGKRINRFSLGQCPYNEAAMKIPNGYISNVSNFALIASNVGSGSLEYSCAPGYALNPMIGGRLTCLSNGAWTTFPVCQCELFHREYFSHESWFFSSNWTVSNGAPIRLHSEFVHSHNDYTQWFVQFSNRWKG